VHTVRKHILEFLKEHEGATVAELAESLGMAPVSVRHHLDILQGDNLICVDRLERKGSVGRPQQIYQLTPEAIEHFPNNFAALAQGLARQIKQILPPEQVKVAFKAMGHEIAKKLTSHELEKLSVEERLEQVANFLSQQGYLARWELAPDSPEGGYWLHKYNCPYAGISAEHGELCLMDQVMVDELMGQPCQRIHSMIEDDHCCTYKVCVAECTN
jgi:predicted ArsR family transcriptional regulator